LIPDFST